MHVYTSYGVNKGCDSEYESACVQDKSLVITVRRFKFSELLIGDPGGPMAQGVVHDPLQRSEGGWNEVIPMNAP